MKPLLVIEDDPDIQTQIKWGLNKAYDVLQARDRASALELIAKNHPPAVTLDLGLPPDEDGSSEGLLCLQEILSRAPETKVIVVTGNNDRVNALKAVRAGAYDYYLKPINMNELKIIIQRAYYLYEIEKENRKLHTILGQEAGFAGMIGQSPGMLKVFDTIHRVASTDASVLITGESGTGKELVARAIHDKSPRSKGPFIAINCGAIPETLLESELFGHEKGSFTGAHTQQNGKFEYSDKGTLFLDEIAEMSPRLQAKLLRFLQEKKIQRVGGRRDIEIDARIIAATNIDLNNAMKEKQFREDLFFRISVISINVPPLRQRGNDVLLLADAFLEKYKALFKKKINGFCREALDSIENYSWPGNVRELENKLQKAVITADGSRIEPEHLGLDAKLKKETSYENPDERYTGMTLKEARSKLEKDLIEGVVKKHKGNIKRACEELGISRPTLYYKLPVKE